MIQSAAVSQRLESLINAECTLYYKFRNSLYAGVYAQTPSRLLPHWAAAPHRSLDTAIWRKIDHRHVNTMAHSVNNELNAQLTIIAIGIFGRFTQSSRRMSFSLSISMPFLASTLALQSKNRYA